MPQYTSGNTLDFMVGRVLGIKPNASQSEVVNALNARIRQVINGRIYWSDLLARRIISIPNPYTTGTISTTTGSQIVTGTSTAWPVSDVVNTTVALGVQDLGYQEITPASMANIKVDTLLYCDSTGPLPETVAVVEVTPTTFIAQFQNPHNAGFTITSSSLAGLQLNYGSGYPIFTVLSIQSPTQLQMDNPWGGPALSNVEYQIVMMYCTIDPRLKVIVDIVDQQVGRRLESYVPETVVNTTDPQRTATGDPLALLQNTPTVAGTMTYEIWPTPTAARQLFVLCGLQWPDLRMDTDRAPWFIDPNLFVTGAMADVLRIKNVRFGQDTDPYFNPALAMTYEQLFRIQMQEAVNADEAKSQMAYQRNWDEFLGAGGANFWQSHSVDVNYWTL